MPVVFTSTLTQSSQNQPSSSRAWQTEVVYSVSQTSQVYLDHQVSEIAGALVFNWDAIEALFPAGVLEDMFSAYVNFLERLANEEELWQAQRRQLLPAAQVEQIAAINHTETDLGSKNALLHGLFFEQVPLNSQKAAIIASSRTLTYQELSDRALTLAHQLQALGVRPHQLVAIVMEKGWEQVVAALGILASGAAYVPIDPELPIERRLHLLQETEAQQIITQSWLDTSLAWPENITRICVDTLESSNNLPLSEFKIQDRSFTSLAYVIYTSGSTGLPKGVAIAHQGAVNTILDINQRFHVTSQDCVLALSSLSFDLSVYDIFGTLAAGGTIVIPDAEATKDPAHWAALLIQHGVTIWNSVPALMQMLVEYLTENSIQSSLRLVMLSGDWLPLNLSDRIRTVFGDTQVVSLGGATEASIWSILYPITTVDPTWKSIPYGRPMANQHFYVLNEALEPCPIWVTGQLYIGGIGLAKGYWRNEEKTNASFIIHPQTKERLYKTGDLGRYLSDGNIEFLGREDFQVKVNGYRIELGEIETILKQHPAIAQAVVSATRQSRENKQLVAYIVPHREVAANLPSSPDQKIAEAYDPHQLNGQPEKAPAAALSKLKDVLSDPVERIEFKLKQLGLRQPESSQSSIQLPQPEFDEKLTQVYLRRQSYRQFLEKAISLEQFSKFISCLVQMKLEGSPLPKYRYASAGSLYPVQTYLYVKPNRVEGLETGIYYYHPAEHRLVLLSANFEIDGSVYGVNQPIFEQSAFSLFLIGQLHAIIPLYGEKARDFCLLEAGYISQLLMETAPEQEIGLCPVGALEFDLLRDSFVLEPSQILLHSLVGGRIDLAWTKQWLQSTTVQKPEAIADKLRQFLCQKLPEYMMPSSYMLLETLPLTSNGKVDRKALPKPDSLCLSAQTKYVAPRSELEKAIASIWQKALKLEKVGIHDNFFDLGGNSLSATQAIAQMRQTLQVELSIRRFFEAPTIADLALAVEQENRGERERPHLDKIERIERGDSQQLLANLDRISEQEMDALLAEMLNEREES
jgi:amino acid adenylation domain-containing protein